MRSISWVIAALAVFASSTALGAPSPVWTRDALSPGPMASVDASGAQIRVACQTDLTDHGPLTPSVEVFLPWKLVPKAATELKARQEVRLQVGPARFSGTMDYLADGEEGIAYRAVALDASETAALADLVGALSGGTTASVALPKIGAKASFPLTGSAKALADIFQPCGGPKAPTHVSAAPAPAPAPTAAPAKVVGVRELTFDTAPASVRKILMAAFDAGKDGRGCNDLSLQDFKDRTGPILETDYNRDGQADYVFSDACEPMCAGIGCAWVVDALWLGRPAGLVRDEKFDRAYRRLDGKPALVATLPCIESLDDIADYDNLCAEARFFDPARSSWGKPLRVEIADDGEHLAKQPRPSSKLLAFKLEESGVESGAGCWASLPNDTLVLADDLEHVAVKTAARGFVKLQRDESQKKDLLYHDEHLQVKVEVQPVGPEKHEEEGSSFDARVVLREHGLRPSAVKAHVYCGA